MNNTLKILEWNDFLCKIQTCWFTHTLSTRPRRLNMNLSDTVCPFLVAFSELYKAWTHEFNANHTSHGTKVTDWTVEVLSVVRGRKHWYFLTVVIYGQTIRMFSGNAIFAKLYQSFWKSSSSRVVIIVY